MTSLVTFGCWFCLLFLFFGMGQVVGVVAVWNKNWNSPFFYIANLKRFYES
jgi:hypothetical protein